MNSCMYRFAFTAPLHISNARADYGKSHTFLHSDSLLAAVMDVWAKIGKSEWINEYASACKQMPDKAPLVLTGAYPYAIAENDCIYFMPKPFYQPPNKLAGEPGDAKKFKKIEWIAWDAYIDLLKGKAPNDENAAHGKFYTGSKATFKAPHAGAVQARVKRPRNEAEDAVPYYIERLHFNAGCGLYTIVSATDAVWQNRCETALNVLQHLGLGTDRNVGNGQFKLETASFSWPDLPPSEYYVNLGLYAPANETALTTQITGESRFDTIKRGGWLGEPFNTYRKKSVYMFKAGSVLKLGANAATINGSLFDLQPDIIQGAHPVYRSGISCFLPIQILPNHN